MKITSVILVFAGALLLTACGTITSMGSGTYTSTPSYMFRIENGPVIEHWDTASKGELTAIMQGDE